MIDAYKNILTITSNRLRKIGFTLKVNSPYSAEFSSPATNCIIELEGDPIETHLYMLFIKLEYHRYSIDKLMEVFDVKEKPTIDTQFNLLVDHYDDIFLENSTLLAKKCEDLEKASADKSVIERISKLKEKGWMS